LQGFKKSGVFAAHQSPILLKDLAMKNKMIRVAIAALALGGAATANAALFDVAAVANSSSGGVGLNTGIALSAGQQFQ
jgi:hypothetical protein